MIETRLDEDEWMAATAAALCAEVKDGRWFDEEDEITDDNGLRLATINSPPVTTHIARNYPARVLRRVEATRSLVAAILARQHVLDDTNGHGCPASPPYSAADGSRFPSQTAAAGPRQAGSAPAPGTLDASQRLGIIAQAHHGRRVMLNDSAIQAAQETADALLEDCDQTLEPLQGNEGLCIVCNRPPVGRLVARKDGTEMAWASVCAEHSDTGLEITATLW